MASTPVGSGVIDVSSIVSQLMSLERAPLNALASRIKGVDARLSEVGKLKAAMDRLRTAATALSGTAGWDAAKASSAQPEAIVASASAGAVKGSYSLQVNALARQQSLVTSALPDADALVGGGTLEITFGNGEGSGFAADAAREPLQITVTAGATLADVRDAINAADGELAATLVNDVDGTRLMIRGTQTGADQAFRITATDDGSGSGGLGLAALSYTPGDTGGALTRLQAASNAQVELDGLGLSLANNHSNELIENLSLQFQQVTTAPVLVEVAHDSEATRAAVETFVTAYNELNSLIRTQTSYDAATKTAGPLQGRQAIVQAQGALRNAVSGTVAGADLARLAEAGIDIMRDGSLKISEEGLTAALADPGRLQALFGSNSTDPEAQGISRRLGALLDRLLGTEGAITGTTRSLEAQRRLFEDQEGRMNNRLSLIEARLIRQYSALDTNLSQMSGMFAALGNLPQI